MIKSIRPSFIDKALRNKKAQNYRHYYDSSRIQRVEDKFLDDLYYKLEKKINTLCAKPIVDNGLKEQKCELTSADGYYNLTILIERKHRQVEPYQIKGWSPLFLMTINISTMDGHSSITKYETHTSSVINKFIILIHKAGGDINIPLAFVNAPSINDSWLY
jgi:hypothetical protein